MGLTYPDLDLLLDAKSQHGAFTRIATIGRQSVYLDSNDVLNLIKRGALHSPKTPDWGEYCEIILSEILGSQQVVSFDASPYEGASITHDMNLPLDKRFDCNFELVIDGGSLEHIFNFPVAILNVMRMVKVGGYVMVSNPANSLCGHGFYQFSPELMFRIFSEEYGFESLEVRLTEHTFGSVENEPPIRLVKVHDPKLVGGRALITTSKPLMVRVLARKIRHVEAFTSPPQQSDYDNRWNESVCQRQISDDSKIRRAIRSFYRIIPKKVRLRINEKRNKYNLNNRRYFERILK